MDAEKRSPRHPWEGLGRGAGCDAPEDESPGTVLDCLTDREGLLLMAETATHRQERLGTAHDLLGDAQGRNQRQKERERSGWFVEHEGWENRGIRG